MIIPTQGDILCADAEAIVNTVNCVGVMGRGIALQFKKAFPQNYSAYRAVCDRKALQPGKMFVFELDQLFNPRYVINFPTKRHWRGKSRMSDIETGLKALVKEVKDRKIRSIAIPPLGSGLGGLNWLDVRRRIITAFENLEDVDVLLFEPKGAPAVEKMAKEKIPPNMTEGRAALLGLMQRYLAAVMDPSITLLEIHKLMYFMQEVGEPLNLRFSKGLYGPYAENLRHVLNKIEGHFISGYGDGEDQPSKQIELHLGISVKAETHLMNHPDTLHRFERVVDLIEGFETPFGMELLSTVHWLSAHEGVTAADAVTATYAWNPRKKMFQENHIRIAWNMLERKGWISAA
jgi:O-acetyl-ADP-ribose deacetylase (regulator of RNase III)